MKKAKIQGMLPEVIQRTVAPGSPLDGLLGVMEALHSPDEEILAHIETYFNPYTASDAFVPYLAGWVDLGGYLADPSGSLERVRTPSVSTGLGRLRELIAASAYLSRWRGTSKGLLGFLQIATGNASFTIEEHAPDAQGNPRPFHLLIKGPKAVEPYRPLIERIIQAEKPAYMTYDLILTG
jgi:phage tail-like protein